MEEGQRITAIYLDSDGPLANWVDYVVSKTGYPDIRTLKAEHDYRGIMRRMYRENMHAYGELSPQPWMGVLLDMLVATKLPIVICSSVGQEHPDRKVVEADKVVWWETHVGGHLGYNLDYDIVRDGRDKALFANANRLLIDDSQLNCLKWGEFGPYFHWQGEKSLPLLGEYLHAETRHG